MVEITTHTDSATFTIHVNGEVDASSSIFLDNALEEAFSTGQHILVDLEKLDYISSAGLGVFISRLEEVKDKEIFLILYGMNDNVKQVFNILGLESLLVIKKDRQEALTLINEA
jgi:anti-sigma B factor antagonist